MGLFTVVLGEDKQIVGSDGSLRPYRWYHALADALYGRWATRGWRRRQNEFRRTGTRYYGDGGTLHRTGHVHVEVRRGIVHAVWFRCQPLPFEQVDIDVQRAIDMQRMYGEGKIELHGVEVKP